MRKSLAILFTLLLCVSVFAQQRTGNIFAKVVDKDGNPLPGVVATLTGPYERPMQQISSTEGTLRFISLSPSRDYSIKLELAGFQTRTETGIVVVVGGNTNLNFTLEQAVLAEQITVTAKSPTVDQKKTAVGMNVTQEILQSMPTARDPWVILQMAPSVIVDRENIGGNESGQQSSYVARGSGDYNNNVWAMDGIVITDPAAIGASPSYYDFDAFEEMNITVGGSDVTVQTGGIALNMVTRRGGNKVSLGGRFYLTDEKFQALNEAKVKEIQKKEPTLLGINKIRTNKDYGFNLGLPIWKDRAWFWASYGVQDIKTTTVYGTPDDTLLENYAAKLNLQLIPENRFELFFHIGGKKKWGRSASASNPEGLYQSGRYYFGSPILKFQDEHMFGDNLFVSVKYAFSDAGFSLTPMTDLKFEKVPLYDITAQRYYGSQAGRYYVERPVNQYNVLVNYFNDNLFGASHDIKVGFEYADRNAYTESVWAGNMMTYRNFNYPTYDYTGDGLPDVPKSANSKYFSFWRGYYSDLHVDAWAGYLSDTITFGRFNLLLGLRFDYQLPAINPTDVLAVDKDSGAWKTAVNSTTTDKLDKLLPGIHFDAISAKAKDGSRFGWQVWSPRIGLTYDVTGDGKTIAKLSASLYGDFMGVGLADFWRPGGADGWLDFYWEDNGDNVIDYKELYWYYVGAGKYQAYRAFDDAGNFIGNWTDAAGTFWASYDPQNPGKTTAPYGTMQKNAGSVRTSELMVSLDREIFTDFSVSLVGTYRKYDRYNWDISYWLDAAGNKLYRSKDMYISAGKPVASAPTMGDTKEAKNHDYYYGSVQATTYTPYYERMKRPGFYRDYFGLDLIFNKRLSNKWMLNANFTWQTQAAHYPSESYLDPTNVWAYNGHEYAAYIGGASGKISQYTYTPWMGKLGGLYQAPWDIDIGFNFQIRQGWILAESFTFTNYTLPNPRSRSFGLMMSPFGKERLPVFYNLNVRVEKRIKAGDFGSIYLMADIFNALNSTMENRRYQMYNGTYYYYGEGNASNRFVKDVNYRALNEIINPRVTRFGVRFTF